MAVNPLSYIKNVGKSLGYIGIDIAKDLNPNIAEFVDNAKSTADQLYQDIGDFKEKISFTDPESIGAEAKGIAVDSWKNLRDDFLSGKWYNAERKKAASDEAAKAFFGDDFDDFGLDDFSFDDDMNSSDNSDFGELELGEKQHEETLDTIESTVSSAANTIASATVKTTECIMANANANTSAMYTLNAQGFSSISAGLATINNNIAAIASLAPAVTTHMQNSAVFYTHTTENQEKMIQLLTNIDSKLIGIDDGSGRSGRDRTTLLDFVNDGGLNLTAMIDYAKEEFKNSLIGSLIGMTKEMGGGLKGMTSGFTSSPIAWGISQAIKFALPNAVKDMAKDINEFIPEAFTNLLFKLKGMADDNSVLGFLSDMIFPDFYFKTKLTPGAYNKGRLSWNGMAQQSLTQVIPFQLSQIVSAVTGNDLEIYDFNSGTWKRKKKIVKEYTDDLDRNIKGQSYEYSDRITSVISTLKQENRISAQQQEDLEQNMLIFFRYIMMNGGAACEYANYNKYFGKDSSYDSNLMSVGVDKLLWTIIKNLGPQKFSAFINDMNRGIFANNSFMKNLEQGSLATMLFNESQVFDETGKILGERYSTDPNKRKSAADKLKESKGGGKNLLAEMKDAVGNSIYDYLYTIALNTSSLKNYVKAMIEIDNPITVSGQRRITINEATLHDIARVDNGFRRSDSGIIVPITANNQSSNENDSSNAGTSAELENYINGQFSQDENYGQGNDYKMIDAMPDDVKEFHYKIQGIKNSEMSDEEKKQALDKLNEEEPEMAAKYAKFRKQYDRSGNLKGLMNKGRAFTSNIYNKIFKDQDPTKFLTDPFGYLRNTMYRGMNWARTSILGLDDKENGPFVKMKDWFSDRMEGINTWLEDRQTNDTLDESGTGSGLYRFSAGASKTEQQDPKLTRKEKFNANVDKLVDNTSNLIGDSISRLENRISKGIVTLFSDKVKENVTDKINTVVEKTFKDNGIDVGGVLRGLALGGGVSLLSGGLINPLIGASVGAGIGFVKNSEKVQDFLFGVEGNGGVMENGTNSLFGDKGREFFEKRLPKIGGGAIAGGVLGMFGGNPLLGAFLGSGLSFAISSDAVQDTLFGKKDEKTGKRALNGWFDNEKVKKFIKERVPSMALGAGAGLLLGPFGGVANIIMGSALGFAASSDKFQKMLFGGEDDKGNEHEGILNKIRESITKPIIGIVSKLSTEIKNATNNFFLSLKKFGRSIFDKILSSRPIMAARNGIRNKISGVSDRLWGGIENVLGGQTLININKRMEASQLNRGLRLRGEDGGIMTSIQRNELRQSYSAEDRAKYKMDSDSFGSQMDTFMASANKETLESIKKMSKQLADPAKWFAKDLRSQKSDVITLLSGIGKDRKYTSAMKEIAKHVRAIKTDGTSQEIKINNTRAIAAAKRVLQIYHNLFTANNGEELFEQLKKALDSLDKAVKDASNIQGASDRVKGELARLTNIDVNSLTDQNLRLLGESAGTDIANRNWKGEEAEKKDNDAKEAIPKIQSETERIAEATEELVAILKGETHKGKRKNKKKNSGTSTSVEDVIEESSGDNESELQEQREREAEEQEDRQAIHDIAEHTANLSILDKAKGFLFGKTNEEGKSEGGIFSPLVNMGKLVTDGWSKYIKPALIAIGAVIVPAVAAIAGLSGKFDNLGAQLGWGAKGSSTSVSSSTANTLIRMGAKEGIKLTTSFASATGELLSASGSALRAVDIATSAANSTYLIKSGNKILTALSKVPILKNAVKPDALEKGVQTLISKINNYLVDNPNVASKALKIFNAASDALAYVKIALMVIDFTTGMEDAENTLKVKEASFGERIACGIYRVVKNLIPIVGPLIPDTWLIDLIINTILPIMGIKNTKIQERRSEAEQELENYNAEHGTNLSWTEYNKNVLGNKNGIEQIGSMFKKGFNSVKAFKDVNFGQSIGNAIADFKENKNFKSAINTFGEGLKPVLDAMGFGDLTYMEYIDSFFNSNAFGAGLIKHAIDGDLKGLWSPISKDDAYSRLVGSKRTTLMSLLLDISQLSPKLALTPIAIAGWLRNKISDGVKNIFSSFTGNVFKDGKLDLLSGFTAVFETITKPFQGIIDKAKDIFKPFTDQIKKGEELIQDPNATLGDWLDMSDTGSTGFASIFKPLLFGYRLMGMPVVATKNILTRINGVVSPIIQNVITTVKDVADFGNRQAKAVADGDLGALWGNAMNFTGYGGDTFNANALEFLMEAGSSLYLTLPTIGSWVGHKIFDAIAAEVEKAKAVIHAIGREADDAINVLKEDISSGASIKTIIADYFNIDKSKPVLQNVASLTTRLAVTPVVAIKLAVGTIGNAITSFVDKVKSDAEKVSALSDILSAIDVNEKDSFKDIMLAYGETMVSFESPLAGVFNFASGVVTIGKTISWVFHSIGRWLRNLNPKTIINAALGFDLFSEEDAQAFANSKQQKFEENKGGTRNESFMAKAWNSTFGKWFGGSGSGSFVSQYDPRYNNKTLGGKSIANNGCGPASAVMALDGTLSMNNAINSAKKYQTQGGTNISYFGDVFRRNGKGAKYYDLSGGATGNDMVRDIANGKNVVLMGQDRFNTSKAYSPFGPNNHYVVAKGFTNNGGVLINDPETSGTRVYSPSILKNVKAAVSASGSNLVRRMKMYNAGASDYITNADTQYAWNFFKTLGYSDAATAAIMGNIAIESSFNLTVHTGDNGKAFGYCQWHDFKNKSGRFAALVSYAEGLGISYETARAQLGFIDVEIFGSQSGFFAGDTARQYGINSAQDFKNCTNVDMATQCFCWGFERPNKTYAHIDSRIAAANYYFNLYKGNYTAINGANNGSTGSTSSTSSEESGTESRGLSKIISAFTSGLGKLFGGSNKESGTSGSTSTTSNPSSVNWSGDNPVDIMKSIEGQLEYSQNGPRDPSKGSADCSSTVRWAIKQAGGPDIGTNTAAQYNNANLVAVKYNNGRSIGSLPSNIEVGDLLFYKRDNDRSNVDHVGHVELYAGDNKRIGHGGGSDGKTLGPTIKSANGDMERLIKVSRVKDMAASGSGVIYDPRLAGGASNTMTKDVAAALKILINLLEKQNANTEYIKTIYETIVKYFASKSGDSDAATAAMAATALANSTSNAMNSKAESDLSDLKAMVDRVLAG